MFGMFGDGESVFRKLNSYHGIYDMSEKVAEGKCPECGANTKGVLKISYYKDGEDFYYLRCLTCGYEKKVKMNCDEQKLFTEEYESTKKRLESGASMSIEELFRDHGIKATIYNLV